MKDIMIRKATMSVNLPIVCAKCKCRGRTENIKIEVEYLQVDDLPDAMNIPIGTHFPVGWAGYGTYYHCPACVSQYDQH